MPNRNTLLVCLTVMAVVAAILCPTPLLENGFAVPIPMASGSQHQNKGNGGGPSMTITTTSLPSGTIGVSYSATLTAKGGKAPFTWSVVQNQLPPGLALNATSGSISGVPTQAGQFSFTVQVADAHGKTGTATLIISIAGVEPQISLVPSTISFGSVTVGNTNTQTVTVSDTGNATLTLSQANLSGSTFSISGLTLPKSIAAGQHTSFNIAFSPGSASSFTGSLSLVSNAPNSPTVIPLSGTGVTATLQLSVSPTSLSFGNVTVGQTSTKSVTVSNSGNSSVGISQVNVSGTGFSASGLTPPVTLDAGQNATISVAFAPTASGSATGSLSVVSNATNSPTTVSLSGSGVTSTSHSVALSWTASTSTVSGYDIYRSSKSGGPYTKLNSSLVTGTSYTDTTVQAGQTYYYVTTAVNSSSVESTDSNQVKAVIPSP